MSTFQSIILNLQKFWTEKGCILQQSHDLQTGAGTFNPETFLRSLGPDSYNVCHVEISRRPTDGRYGENPNRLQRFHQFQVMMKPTPDNMQELYLQSLEAIGFDLKKHDIRFVHDDWESPTQGASGLGWEVWCDGMEITQFTYFQQIGGVPLTVIPAELAYGIERIALFLQQQANVYDLQYNEVMTYGEVFLEAEKEYCVYNFEEASVEALQKKFEIVEAESKLMIEKNLPIPAYDLAVEASHSFNMLDARGAISTTARVAMIHRVRDLCCSAAKCYLEKKVESHEEIEELEESSYPPMKEISKGTCDFLLEVGTEHLPANAIPAAATSLEKLIKGFCADESISFESMEVFATPRRLGVLAIGMDTHTAESFERKKGPSLEIAFEENGRVKKPGEGFFRSIGVDISIKEQMVADSRFEVENGRIIYLQKKEKQFTGHLLQKSLRQLILSIQFPKKMRWGREGVMFARPIRSLVAMLGKSIIEFEIEGVKSSNMIMLNAQVLDGKKVALSKPSEYKDKLKKGKVLASAQERKEYIDEQLEKISKEHGVDVVQKEAVTSQVLFLSEYPELAVGEFEERFLSLPGELIISEMIDHQKYYPTKKEGKICTKFVVGVDKEPTGVMMSNYEAVLTARLSDGLFLYQKDLRASFAGWNKSLEEVVLHPKLGSIYNKVERICSLCDKIAEKLDVPFEKNAALYCKADLVSDVVYEFPDLQGIMGKYYALEFGETSEVAYAIEESYLPLLEGGDVARSKSGIVVALSDRIDSLMSYMGIGLVPTSSKDPYALRRAAVGVIRTLIENKISFDLTSVIEDPKVTQFVIGRMRSLLKEYGFSSNDIEMCGVYASCNPYLIYRCVSAISRMRGSADAFERLAGVYRRIKGSASLDGGDFKEDKIEQEEERDLYNALSALEQSYKELLANGKFEEAFNALTELVDPLEKFFDKVRVQVEDVELCKNRKALLNIPYALISSTLNL